MALKGQKKGKKSSGLEEIVSEIKSKYGEGSIMKLGEVRKVNVDSIPTGALSLDIALGVGGIPRGRIIEIFGPESSGKSTLCLHIISEAQKKGGVAAFVDAEHALDPEYARRLGVNIEDLLISQPDSGEQALDIVETLVKSGKVDLIVIDSVAALTPKAEIEGRIDEQQVGLQARLMSKALRRLTSMASQAGTIIIFTNQTRMKIGIRFGDPETTPGGKALKFYASVRIRLVRAAKIQKGDEIVGNRVRAKVVKNKVAPPFRETEFDILYNQGIDKLGDIIRLGEKKGILVRSGSWYSLGKEKLGPGLDGAKKILQAKPKLLTKIEGEIKKAP